MISPHASMRLNVTIAPGRQLIRHPVPRLDPARASAQPPVSNETLRQQTIAALSNAIKLEPTAERGAPAAQQRALHDSRGRAIFMLVTLLERQPPVDYRQVASLLDGYEQQYPAMSLHFSEIYTWRLTAFDQTGQYAALDQQAQMLAQSSARRGA